MIVTCLPASLILNLALAYDKHHNDDASRARPASPLVCRTRKVI
ncbi:hypothetical protein [Thalassospira profundimaris]|nr:hypothetical protein [Thalassospira profundimaris]